MLSFGEKAIGRFFRDQQLVDYFSKFLDVVDEAFLSRAVPFTTSVYRLRMPPSFPSSTLLDEPCRTIKRIWQKHPERMVPLIGILPHDDEKIIRGCQPHETLFWMEFRLLNSIFFDFKENKIDGVYCLLPLPVQNLSPGVGRYHRRARWRSFKGMCPLLLSEVWRAWSALNWNWLGLAQYVLQSLHDKVCAHEYLREKPLGKELTTLKQRVASNGHKDKDKDNKDRERHWIGEYWQGEIYESLQFCLWREFDYLSFADWPSMKGRNLRDACMIYHRGKGSTVISLPELLLRIDRLEEARAVLNGELCPRDVCLKLREELPVWYLVANKLVGMEEVTEAELKVMAVRNSSELNWCFDNHLYWVAKPFTQRGLWDSPSAFLAAFSSSSADVHSFRNHECVDRLLESFEGDFELLSPTLEWLGVKWERRGWDAQKIKRQVQDVHEVQEIQEVKEVQETQKGESKFETKCRNHPSVNTLFAKSLSLDIAKFNEFQKHVVVNLQDLPPVKGLHLSQVIALMRAQVPSRVVLPSVATVEDAEQLLSALPSSVVLSEGDTRLLFSLLVDIVLRLPSKKKLEPLRRIWNRGGPIFARVMMFSTGQSTPRPRYKLPPGDRDALHSQMLEALLANDQCAFSFMLGQQTQTRCLLSSGRASP